MRQTVQQFFKRFPDDAACLTHLMERRYGVEHTCSKCKKHSRHAALNKRRAYSCQWCGHHVYPCVGTPMHRSRTSLQLWFYAIYLFTATRHGVSAMELHRQLGVTYKCAWRMAHQIREYMQEMDGDGPLAGDVEVDEAYIGGAKAGKRGRGADGKTIIVAMQDRDGEMIANVIPDVTRKTLHAEITENVVEGSTIHTDELRSYKTIDQHGYEHKTVEHGKKEYARDGSHVNTVEAFFGIFKRSIASTHIFVSQKHLEKYLGEFEFRQNHRHDPHQMFPKLMLFPR